MLRARFIVLAGLWLSGCTSTIVNPPEKTHELLSGQLLFGHQIETSSLNDDEIMAITDEMRAYVHSKVRGHPQANTRLRRLVGGMVDDGLLTMSYDAGRTLSATDTFQQRAGNCLSFSILFAALAREGGLDAVFQMVDVPPSFRADGDVIMLDRHINVRILGLRKNILYSNEYVVDFNNPEFRGNHRSRKVKDSYAIALYYSNLAVESMIDEDWESAFRYLKKSVETDFDIPDVWVNLGVLYSWNDQPEMAAQAYQQALSIQPSNRSALVNLTTTLKALGRVEEAQYYSGRVDYYRNRHPYYHYFLAQTAYEEGRLDDSMLHLARAIELKDDEHQFYYLRGLIHQQSNDLDRAAGDYALARDIAGDPKLIAGYERKLKELESQTY